MIDLFCNLNSEIELISTVDLDNKINHNIGDISSIFYKGEIDKTYLLSDSDPGYYVQINDNLLNNSNNKKFNSEKVFFKENKKNFKFDNDSESFHIDEKNMFVLNEISSYKSALLKYRYIDNELEKYVVFNKLSNEKHSISDFQRSNLIIIASNKDQIKAKNSNTLKYKIISKELDFISSGLILTDGLLGDFQKINNTDLFLSVIDEGNNKKIGIYKLEDFLNKKMQVVEPRLYIKLPKNIAKIKNIQGISIGPKLSDNNFSILLTNDNNKQGYLSKSKVFPQYLKILKYRISRFLGKAETSQILILKVKGNKC